MHTFIKILKPLSFLPAIAMMIIIYAFSAQSGEVSGALSYEISYDIVEVKDEIMHTGYSPTELARQARGIHHYVRKAAHVTEYLILAICVAFPLYVYGIRGFFLFFFTCAFCVTFAGFDEYHQSFVGGRGPSPKDVAIDSIGIFTGSLLVETFCYCVLHNPGRERVR